MSDDRVRSARMESPLGALWVTVAEGALTGLYMDGQEGCPSVDDARGRDDDAVRPVAAQLVEYFEGRRTAFDLPVRPRGTPFQLKVWEALREIPFGTTVSYAELARRIGAPTSARAVGAAVGKNPIGIVVPCHRVVGASGALTGFAGGLDRKRWLLDHEGARPLLR
ncbi:MAG TPA: methylated-DNA--[protein]-cysteine S-methyltransferase [Isosphaeraceae bacterium]|nr:methylated-DNA--[protein]-cysteine S-methyltransferase [Isosphaeraceae bacterium]